MAYQTKERVGNTIIQEESDSEYEDANDEISNVSLAINVIIYENISTNKAQLKSNLKKILYNHEIIVLRYKKKKQQITSHRPI